MSGAEGFLRLATLPRSRTSSPLSRSAGEGPGVRAAPAHNGCAGTGRTQRDIWVFDQALRAGLNIPLGCGFGLLRQCFSSPLYLAVRLYLMQAARRKAVQ